MGGHAGQRGCRRARKGRAQAYLARKGLGLQVGGWCVNHCWPQPAHLQITGCPLLLCFLFGASFRRQSLKSGQAQPRPRADWWLWVQKKANCQPNRVAPPWFPVSTGSKRGAGLVDLIPQKGSSQLEGSWVQIREATTLCVEQGRKPSPISNLS